MLLEVCDLHKSFPQGSAPALAVLRGVSLALDAGESLAITGPSGSGKSTLLNCLGLLDTPDSGSVKLGGHELLKLKKVEAARTRSRQIGFVFQLHHLLPQLTVLENVLLPSLALSGKSKTETKTEAEEDAHERAAHLLARVGLTGKADCFPATLSGGERLRAAVARALVNRPRLLLADEPTGSLDHAAALDIAKLLRNFTEEEGAALVAVTHSEEVAALLGRRVRLADGRLDQA